jgi:hypothetical protein
LADDLEEETGLIDRPGMGGMSRAVLLGQEHVLAEP